jgi:hypothetical protein
LRVLGLVCLFTVVYVYSYLKGSLLQATGEPES